MALYQFHDDYGTPMDAHFEVQDEILILHSRGETIGAANARNTKYGPALRILLERIEHFKLTLVGVWVDSKRVQNISMEERQILYPEEVGASPAELFTWLSNRMAQVGRAPNSRSRRGNSNKRLRFAFAGNLSGEQIVGIVGKVKMNPASRKRKRLPAERWKLVCRNHIQHAVKRLLSGSDHPFGESTDYDVIAEDGTRLPPKAVFGLAASEAFGFEVLPQHFVGGMGTPCFRAIRTAGYTIVRKRDEVLPDPSDREWAEGDLKRVTHLRRERGPGVAKAKKEDFLRKNDRLFCERCGLDPKEAYGPDLGEACIEVHHKLPLAEMLPGHSTHLDDLLCVCANCHRIIHRELRNSNW